MESPQRPSIAGPGLAGPTQGMFVADPKEYGADKLWCLLKGIAIELSDTSDPEDSESDDQPAAGAAGSSGV